jgi:hypothetical protein
MSDYAGRNERAANYLKAVRFDSPSWVPCSVWLLPATWMEHREGLQEVVLAHPRLFPGFRKGSRDFDAVDSPTYQLGRHTDCWGCIWENIRRGMEGAVHEHPLADWEAMRQWRPPDPQRDALFGPRDWNAVARGLAAARERGDVAGCGPLPHGFFYMLLYYLRGFENFMLDLATDEPRLMELIRIVQGYNAFVIGRCLELGAEMIYLGEDLGLQKSLPMSPAMWRRYIKPSYERMLGQCRNRNVPVYLHSDGHILEIIPDLLETGVRVLNPQVGANGLDGLKRVAKGKVCINLDLDRQMFPFATAGQIEQHIGQCHETLYDPRGGLMLVAECGPDVPLETIELICATLEKVCFARGGPKS